ncbi:NlpC/P60 family protein [Granulicoccus phenolivorans]|uniref:C40 family peptidase n=1 Tax=Granulicoccus phenolivorans TaxID=266854 RepID=UPI0004217250|nr:C40 family peptidase [Granulicoccus phenolivorans]
MAVRRTALNVCRGLLAAGVVVVAVTGLPGTAHADPQAVEKAKSEVERLSMESAAVEQKALDAQLRLDGAQKRLTTREGDVKSQEAKVEQLRQGASRVALTQYQTRDSAPALQLVSRNDSQNFLTQYSTVQQVNQNQNALLQNYQTEQANLNDLKRGAAADVTTINDSTAEVKRLQAESAKNLADAQQVLDKLSAEERDRLKKLQEEEQAAAARRAEAASAAATTQSPSASPSASASKSASPSASASASKSASPSASASKSASPSKSAAQPTEAAAAAPAPAGASGRAATAVAFAIAQNGKPYSFGATGPGSYDCSGLTGAAWKAAGVSLPRTSQAQYGVGTPVAKSDLQPGDLVFYYSGISHVGIYVGDGMIFHASNPSKPLGYAPLDSMPYMGARRVG